MAIPPATRYSKRSPTASKGSGRNTDFLARYGGDEFALIMPETHLEKSRELAARIQHAVATCPLPLPEGNPLAIAIGLAQYPQQASTAQAFLEAADAALYRAKKARPAGN